MGFDDVMEFFMGTKLRVGLTVAGIAALVGSCAASPHFDRDTYRATVTEKVVKRYDKSDKYLIFTKLEDGSIRIFENTDSLLEGKFSSSDLYAKLEAGKTYDIKTYGWRVPLFSWYENILGAEQVSDRVKAPEKAN